MILETSWGTPTGWIIVRDLLVIGEWHHENELSKSHQRAPTDYDADHVLLRTVRCVNGEVQVVLDCEPVFDYGRTPAKWSYPTSGYHEGLAAAEGIDVELRLTTDMRIGFEGGRAKARTLLKEGQQVFCALSWSEHAPPTTFDDAYAGWSGRRTTGSTGWPRAPSRITRGAATSSAARSRSRA